MQKDIMEKVFQKSNLSFYKGKELFEEAFDLI